MTREITVSGRRVAFDCRGSSRGFPVFLLHGTPGSRSGPALRPSVLYRLGVQLISYDRPGYGRSDRDPARTVADAAQDVLAIADALDLKEFSVIGRSGGGPHALACAALLGKWVQRAAVLVSIAPSEATDLNWDEGMCESNVSEYELASHSVDAVTADLTQRAARIAEDPRSLLEDLQRELTAPDLKVINDAAIRQQLKITYAEAVREGADGWIDDVLAFRKPWGFNVADIKVPVLLWHGADDVFSPVAHTHWLARHIPEGQRDVKISAGMAHFDAMEILPEILVWAKGGTSSEGLRIKRAHQPALTSQR